MKRDYDVVKCRCVTGIFVVVVVGDDDDGSGALWGVFAEAADVARCLP